MTESFQTLQSLDELEALYPAPSGRVIAKAMPRLIPTYAAWIAASRFCVLSSVGPEGTDGTPRGDDGPVVEVFDDTTLLMPDWRGNNRIDTLRNILSDGRVSLMFMVPGALEVMRVNGSAQLSTDPKLLERFSDRGRAPKLVIVIHVEEAYPQCARALMRSGLWKAGDERDRVPGMSALLSEVAEMTAKAAQPVPDNMPETASRAEDDVMHESLRKDMW